MLVDTERRADLDVAARRDGRGRPSATATRWRGSTSWPQAATSVAACSPAATTRRWPRSVARRGGRPAGLRPAGTRLASRRRGCRAACSTALIDQGLQRVLVPQGAPPRPGQVCTASRPSSTRSTWSAAGTGSTAAGASCSTSSSCPSARSRRCARVVERLAGPGVPSFLAVLKRFGAGQPGAAVVPDAGLDARARHPGRDRRPGRLLDELDRPSSTPAAASTWPRTPTDAGCDPAAVPAAGRVAGDPRQVDPDRRLAVSDLARRLGLV